MADFVILVRADGYLFIICGVGMVVYLVGVVAVYIILLVIGVFLFGGALDGFDVLFVIVQMFWGIPVVIVVVDGVVNVVLLVVQILVVIDLVLVEVLVIYWEEMVFC